MAFIWLVNGGPDPPHLLSGMILQILYYYMFRFWKVSFVYCHGLLSEKSPPNPRIRRDVVVAMSLDQPLASHPSWCGEVPFGPWEPWETLENLCSCHYRCGEDELEILWFVCLFLLWGITCHYLVFVDFGWNEMMKWWPFGASCGYG